VLHVLRAARDVMVMYFRHRIRVTKP